MIKKIIFSLIFPLVFATISAQTIFNMHTSTDTLDCNIGGILYDSGGSGSSYANNELFFFTICSDDITQSTAFDFNAASFGAGDYVCVYDGVDVSAPLLNCYNNVNPVPINQIVRATTSNISGCLTFQFYSDPATVGDFEIELMCLAPCQEIISQIVSSSPPINPLDTTYIDLCFNDTLTLNAQGLYTENDLNYHQSDASSYFYWQVGGIMDTAQTFSHFLTDEGFYPITLTIEDSLGCFSVNEHNLVVRYVPRPTFNSLYDSILCLNETATFYDIVAGNNIGGNVIIGDTVRTSGLFSISSAAQYIPDDADGISGNGITTPATYDIDVTGFIPGSTIASGSQVVEICLDIEHSFAGDIDIVLVAPNGSQIHLVDMNPPSGPGANYGTPIAMISPTAPGIPETYCWAPAAGLPAIIPGAIYPAMIPPSTPISATNPFSPANDYQAFGNWDNFIGTPVNGMWTIQVYDDYGGDDGFIFGAQFAFDSAFIPPPDSFYVYYDALGVWQPNPNIISTNLDTNYVDYFAQDAGVDTLFYTTTSNFACYEVDTLIFFVDSFSVEATPEDTTVCVGEPVQLNTIVSGTSGAVSYNWSPSTDLNNSNIANPIATLSSVGIEYVIGATNYNSCTFYDTVNINIQQDFEFSAMSDTFICLGDTVQLHTFGGATSTAWTASINNNSISDTSSANPYVYPTLTTTYTVQADSVGCSQYANITVAVSNLTAFILPTNASCGIANGSMFIIGSGGLPGATLQYSIDGGITFQTGISFSGLNGGTYPIVVSDGSACEFHDTVVITGGVPLEIDTVIIQHPCGGLNDGSINAVLTNPGLAVTYTLDVGLVSQDSSLFNGLGGGTYIITISDGVCPSIDTTITLVASSGAALVIDSVAFENASCSYLNDGFIDVALLNPDTSVNYNYSMGSLTQDSSLFDGLSTGTYIITINDGLCSSVDTIITLTQPNALILSVVDSSNITCFNGMDGVINLSASGGTPIYNYSLDGIIYSPVDSFIGLDTGVYTIYLQDDNLCIDSSLVSLTQPDSLVLQNVIVNDVLCNGGVANLSFDAIGGTGSYLYSIDGVPTFTTANSYTIGVGNYVLQVQDDMGCLSEIHLDTISEPSVLNLVLDSTHNTNCGVTDGAIFVSSTGGFSTHSYTIDGGVTSQDSTSFLNLASNIYIVQVTDVNGCTDTIHAQVFDNTPVTLNITSFDSVSCFGASDATVLLSASLGALPYQFNVDGGANQFDSLFTNLSGGTHVFNVIDSNGCTFATSINIYEPNQLVASYFQDSVSCYGLSDGSITLAVAGGAFPYSYSLDSLIFQTNPVFTNTSSGSYTAYIYDDNACSIEINPMIVYQPDTLIITNVIVQDISCNGDNDGSFTVTTTGGTMPYYFNVNGGVVQTSNILENLSGGVYTINITDENNCPTVSVVDSIFEPVATSVIVDSFNNITCFNGNDGYVSVVGSGGVSPYLYSIDGTTFQSDSFFNNLIAGNYTITLKDDNDCISTVSLNLTQATEIVFTTSSNTVSCAGLSDGVIFINAVGGGTPPYFVSFDGASQIQFTDTISFFGLLGAANYTVEVSDSNGCQAQTITLQIVEPNPLELLATTIVDVTCFGDGDGSVNLLAQEGTPIYTFSLNIDGIIVNSTTGVTAEYNNLSGGQYPAYLVDVNGCTDTLMIDIFEPAELIIDSMIILSQVSCFGDDNGSILVTASGGSPYSLPAEPYTYVWNPSGATDHKDGPLTPGIHTVTVTDANGCSVSASETIDVVLPIIATIMPDSSFISMGDTVQLSVNVQNNLSNNLQYSWTPTTGLSCTDCANPYVTVYNDITYSVVVTDSSGCENYNYTESLVDVSPFLYYFIPSGFSPNNDGLNDRFQVYGQDIYSVDMMVFNRWGEKIFQGNNQFQTWDGTYNGKQQAGGVYTFAVEIKFLNNAIVNKKGSVTLIK